MSFLNTIFLIILPLLLIAVVGFIIHATMRRRRALEQIYGSKLGFKVVLSKFKRQLRYLMLLIAVIFLSLTAARPWWGEIRTNVSGNGRDIVFVLDVSKSMLAQDVAPSRLAHAKFMIKEIMRSNPSDRFALVVFSGIAVQSCPLTNDSSSVEMALDYVDVDTIPVGGTNVQEAMKLVLKSFSGAEGANRAVVMFSDGEELTGDSVTLLEELKSQHIPLFIMGVGDAYSGAMIPIKDENGAVTYLRDSSGNLVQTKLNDALLATLAERTGGEYINSSTINSGLGDLNRALKSVDSAEFSRGKEVIPIERFMPFLIIGVISLVGFMLISERPSRFLMWAGVMLIGMNTLYAQDSTTTPPEDSATSAKIDEKFKNVKLYQAGRLAQLSGDLAEAEDKYTQAVQSDGEKQDMVRQYGYHNLGVLKHTNARDSINKAMISQKLQNLDKATEELDIALNELNLAEELYINAMQTGVNRPESLANTANTQQLLLLDRQKAEQMKEDIEELKEQQKKTQEAIEKAQKQNQEKQENKDESGSQGKDGDQGQKGNQGEQSDQGGQGQQADQGQQSPDQNDTGKDDSSKSNQNGASDPNSSQTKQGTQGENALDNAKSMTEEFKAQAEQMGQTQMKNGAEEAEKNLDKAQEQQESQDYEGASESIKNALVAMQGGEAPSEDSSGEGKDKQQSAEKKAGDQGQPQPQPKPQPQPSEEQGEAGQGEGGQESMDQQMQDIDANMADQLLDSLNQDERELRERLKKKSRQFAPKKVDKDW